MRHVAFAIMFLGVAACSGPVVAPEDYAVQLPAEVELTAEQRGRVTELAESALKQANAGSFAEAATQARAALAIDARAARPRAVLGFCLLQEARVQEPLDLDLLQRGEGELLLARRMDPTDAEVHYLLAQFYRAEGHLSRAAKEFDDLLGRAPSHARARHAAGMLRYELGEELAAAEHFEIVLKGSPGDSDVRYRLAWCRARIAQALGSGLDAKDQKRQEETRRAWGEAIRHFGVYRGSKPDDVEGYLGEAQARFARGAEGDVEQALVIYEAASKVGLQDPRAYFGAGVVHEARGDVVQARTSYGLALGRDPDHVPSLLNMLALLDAAGEKDAARKMAAHALTLKVTGQERRALQSYVKG